MNTSLIRPEFADLAKTLGHPHRLALLDTIAQNERSVETLAALCELSIANTSQHLQHLRRAGFVETRRDGKHVLYRLGDGPVVPLLAALRRYGEHHHGILHDLAQGRISEDSNLETITRDELVQRLDDDSILLLDVRPNDEFANGHLPGAVNIPIEDLQSRLQELPKTVEIVAYCRGPYCALSSDAVKALETSGYTARKLLDGFPDWKAAGLAIATNS